MIGSIISGTHRLQDLGPAFLDTLRDVAPAEYAQLTVAPFPPVRAYAMEDDNSEWWENEDASYLLENLEDILGEHAPEFSYFGAHEGGGADIGFWIAWDAIEDAIHDGDLKRVGDLGELPSDWRGPALVITDRGNAALYDTDGEEVWSVV